MHIRDEVGCASKTLVFWFRCSAIIVHDNAGFNDMTIRKFQCWIHAAIVTGRSEAIPVQTHRDVGQQSREANKVVYHRIALSG